MKIAVIDDDRTQLRLIEGICREFTANGSIKLSVEAFSDGNEFLKKSKLQTYMIAFIDIFMGAINGVDLARRIREDNKDIIIVFLTTSHDFMPQAFSVHAFEYVTKPYTKERIFRTLHDALAVLPDMTKIVELVCDRRKIQIVMDNIVSVESDAHYLKITVIDGSVYRPRMTVSDFLNLIHHDPKLLEVNKGVILNVDFIKHIENSACVLMNGKTFPIRIRDKKQIESYVREYMFGKLRKKQL